MAKINLNDIQSIYDLTQLNQDFADIESEFQNKVLYRDNPVGEPNQMENDLDMNSSRILNLPKPTSNSEAARLADVQAGISGNQANLIQYNNSNVQEALDTRTVFVADRTEMKALTVAVGTNVYLAEGGRSGAGVIKSGTPPSDPQEGIYVVLTNGDYWERLEKAKLTPEMFGAIGDNTADDTVALTEAINMSVSLSAKLWITKKHIVTGALPYPSYLHIVALPDSRITGNFSGAVFLDARYDSAAGHSYGQVVEHLFVVNSIGDCYNCQPRNMKISYGRISAAGYGLKMSSASDQAFENYIDHVLFKGCTYPLWSIGQDTDPVSSSPGYPFANTDCWVTNCIFDGYSGASPVMQYSYVGGASGWFFRNNHWYGSLGTAHLKVRGLNVSISDYFEKNGTDHNLELLSGNPSSYNLAGSTFWLSPGGKAVKFDQGSFADVRINFAGAVVTGGDNASNVIDATYVQSGSSAQNCVINMSGIVKDHEIGYSNNTLRVFGISEPLYKYDNSGANIVWGTSDLREVNIFNKDDSFTAELRFGNLPLDHRGKRYLLYNNSPARTVTITVGSATVILPDGTSAGGYNLVAGDSILFIEQGGNYRVVSV